ncbi:MAG: ATP-binding cassette domain-containing protein [Rhodobacteraceae bacterium]|nr:ATP-binding cassette domain-containing protein [Paracoccaceae bacterium]
MDITEQVPATRHVAADDALINSAKAARYADAPPYWVRLVSGFLGFFSSLLALGLPAIVLLLLDRSISAGNTSSLPALLALGFGTILSVCLIDLMRMKALENYFSNVRGLVLFQDACFAAFWAFAILFIHPLLGVSAAASGALLYLLWRFRSAKRTSSGGISKTLEVDPLTIEAVGLGSAYVQKASLGEISTEEQPDFQTIGQAALLNFIQMLGALTMLFAAVWLHMIGQISLGTGIAAIFLNQYVVTVFIRCFQVQSLKPPAPDLSFFAIVENLDKADKSVPGTAEPGPALLAIEDLEDEGFQPLSVDVFQGLCLTFIGPSGSGKSKVLKAIATGVFSEGKISYKGRNWGRNHGRFHSLSYAPPTPVTMAGTLVENVTCFDPLADQLSAIELIRKLDPYEDVFQASDFLNDAVAENFSAQGQVLSLARTFWLNREIIVLDTPETYLDKASLSALMALILQAKTDGKIVLLATDNDYLMSAADDVIKLERGHVTDRGPKNEVLVRHHARWVRVSFLPTKRDAFRLSLWLDTQFPEGTDIALQSRVKRVAQDMLFLAPRDRILNSNDEILFDVKMSQTEVFLTMHDRGDVIQAEHLENAAEEGLEDFARIVNSVDDFDQTLREGYRQFSTRFAAPSSVSSTKIAAEG